MTAQKVKLIIAVIASALLLILVVQNTEQVETRILLATITMPRALLLFLMALTGFIIGLLAAFSISKRKKPS